MNRFLNQKFSQNISLLNGVHYKWLMERNRDIAEVIGLGNDAEALSLWKKAHRYHRRSLVETTMSRWKGLLGAELSSRGVRRQENEVQIKLKPLPALCLIRVNWLIFDKLFL